MVFYYSEHPSRPGSYMHIDPEFIDLCERGIRTIICCPHDARLGNLLSYAQGHQWGICVFTVNKESDTDKLLAYWKRHGKLKKAFYNSIGAKRAFFMLNSQQLYDWVHGEPVDAGLIRQSVAQRS